MTTTAIAAEAPARVKPFAKPYRHPLQFLGQKVVVLAYAGLGVYLGTLIIAALYYLLWETTPTMKHFWDYTLVPNSNLRHTIRDVGEGLLGAILGLTLAHNHYKRKIQKRLQKPRNMIDRFEIALGIPNVKDGKPFRAWQLPVTLLILVPLYAVPGFFLGYEIVAWFHHLNTVIHTLIGTRVHQPFSSNPTTHSMGAKMKAMWTADWPKKLVGYFSAFVFGRRPARGLIDHLQEFFAQRRARTGKPCRWWHTAPYKARVAEAMTTVRTTVKPSPWLTRVIIGASVIGFGLACFGWYVLAYIA